MRDKMIGTMERDYAAVRSLPMHCPEPQIVRVHCYRHRSAVRKWEREETAPRSPVPA